VGGVLRAPDRLTDAPAAVEVVRPTMPEPMSLTAQVALALARVPGLDVVLRAPPQRGDPKPVEGFAWFYLALGEKDSALATLERAFATRPALVRTLKVAPTFDPLRGEPRFRNLLKSSGSRGKAAPPSDPDRHEPEGWWRAVNSG